MKKIEILSDSCNLTLRSLLLIALVFQFMSQAVAQDQKKKKKKAVPVWEVDFSLATIYDDNILKYSDQYIQRFLNNEDSGRFHIETYDDVIINPALNLSATSRIFGKKKSELDVNYVPRFYVVNGIKNWTYLSVGFRQFFAKKASFKFTLSYVPDFYIRHFRDDDWVEIYGYTPITYQPMGFSKNYYGFWVQNTFLKNTTVRLTTYYAQYYYNKHYTEYDCKDFSWGVRLYQPVLENLKFEMAYDFVTSDAKGYDEPGETRETANESDASFFSNAFAAKIAWKLPFFPKLTHNLNIEGGYERRIFISEHYLEVDPLHTGRIDNVYEMSVTYEVKLYKSLELAAFYNFLMRNTETRAKPNERYVSNEKDYNQNQIGLALTYKLKF
jgi:hypothetical protein